LREEVVGRRNEADLTPNGVHGELLDALGGG
jgi:hypothetical protein